MLWSEKDFNLRFLLYLRVKPISFIKNKDKKIYFDKKNGLIEGFLDWLIYKQIITIIILLFTTDK